MRLEMSLVVAALFAGAATVVAQTSSSSTSFELKLDPYAAYQAVSIAQGDFNRDGIPDLVVGGGATGTTITLQQGNGDGTFRPPLVVGQADSQEVLDVEAVDLNGDGKLDVVVLCIGGTFDVFYGNGDGTFQPSVAVATKASPRSMAVGGFYGDGLMDIAVGDVNGNIEIFKNVGGKNFVLANSVAVESNMAVNALRAGSLTGTAVADLGALTPDGAYVLWGDGRGGFSPVLLKNYLYGKPLGLNVVRLNQDGIEDVVVTYNCATNPGNAYYPVCGGIDAFYGLGNRGIRYEHLVSEPNVIPGTPWAVDINGDGVADLVSDARENDTSVTGVFAWMGHPDATFDQTAQQFGASTDSGGAIVPGDWNRDGMMDFAGVLPGQGQTEIYINATHRAPCVTSPISTTVTVCQPVDNTYVANRVTVDANAYDRTTITAIQEYVDNQLFVTGRNTVQLSFSTALPLGPHFLVTKAWDAKGVSFRSDRNVTEYAGTPGPTCAVGPSSAAICLPAGSSSASPVRILANASTSLVPSSVQLYIDGNEVINDTSGGTTSIDTTRALATGTHDLVFQMYDPSGRSYRAEKSVTVQ